jgi:hypothetical protein
MAINAKITMITRPITPMGLRVKSFQLLRKFFQANRSLTRQKGVLAFILVEDEVLCMLTSYW